MTKVIIHGEMGKIFGETHEFKVSKLLEILKALSITRNGFKNYVINQYSEGINYAMIDPKNPEKKFKSAQDFQEADAPETIHIVPAISGAIAGTIIAIGKFVVSAATALGSAISAGGFLGNLIIGIIIQGIMSLLFPVELPKAQTAETKVDTSSYIFSNLDNNLVQGFPIPLVYGELRIGSNIIGTNVVSEDLG
jgi:predicted phage tail protein